MGRLQLRDIKLWEFDVDIYIVPNVHVEMVDARVSDLKEAIQLCIAVIRVCRRNEIITECGRISKQTAKRPVVVSRSEVTMYGVGVVPHILVSRLVPERFCI